MIPAHPVWMDVQNGSIYPVFDALRGTGDGVTYTYPDQATDPYDGGPATEQWTVDRDGVLVATAGHLHPGGLHTDLYVDAATARRRTCSSREAKYYEPAGAVSWDVAMTATQPGLARAVQEGRRAVDDCHLRLRARLVVRVDGHHGRVDGRRPAAPATTRSPPRSTGPGMLTHGHLAENDHHGGQPDTTYHDLTKLAVGAGAGRR